jgi:hypothetical protein
MSLKSKKSRPHLDVERGWSGANEHFPQQNSNILPTRYQVKSRAQKADGQKADIKKPIKQKAEMQKTDMSKSLYDKKPTIKKPI